MNSILQNNSDEVLVLLLFGAFMTSVEEYTGQCVGFL